MRRALAVPIAWAALASCGTSAIDVPTREQLLDPKGCATCHADHYRDWAASMHAYASDDPVLLAFIARGQRETKGALGSLCVECHAPMAIREGATTDGTNMATVPAALHGVTCFYCHSVDAITETHNDGLHLATDGVMRGPFADPAPTPGHASSYSPLHDRDRPESSALCGACHDLRVGDEALERTYAEWQTTVFANPGGGASCGQCHMPRSAHEKPIAQAPGALLRRYHGHDMPGLDVSLGPNAPQKGAVQSLLDTTLQSALCVGAGNAGIEVILDNVAAGHLFPSGGAQHRRAWVEVVAYANERVVYQSGVVPDGAPLRSVSDRDRWEMRECMLDARGKETLFAWEEASFEAFMLPAATTFDRLDPAYYQTHVRRDFPRAAVLPEAPDRVTMRVRVQPIALEILDALIASGDLDPAIRERMPVFDTAGVEWTPSKAHPGWVNGGIVYSCVTSTNMDFRADRVPAPEPKTCTR